MAATDRRTTVEPLQTTVGTPWRDRLAVYRAQTGLSEAAVLRIALYEFLDRYDVPSPTTQNGDTTS
jgi:hypothetical protein